ncbi:hypothetical protein NIM87_18435 [Devosia sp. XJ19-1]|uniref:Uncharacterized protein n=1 Tax=Devosia ureilytica TaxID=2952754 RepID=A0A9Q4ASW7_9HYPH|nr:hypothetical protein [Devosia ureilytica]MCP8885482.1 hypothetical protein [Devosia ureilytica]MCP8889061.1 hypothetical protein [Devosia ureilytica]
MTKLAIAVAILALTIAPTAPQQGECNIKGNVSTRGEKIYHMPGQRHYDDTRI